MVADCVPLLLLTGNRPLAAAVHVGRGGLLAGIAVKAVDELRRRGGEDVSAVLGPSICGRCYEVPPSMRDEADALAPGAAATTSWGTPSVDIPRALVRQLASRGVEEVRLLGVCTFEDPAYFSHRRACAAGGKAGRFAGIAEATRDTPA
jgi:putative ABC transporter, permease protein